MDLKANLDNPAVAISILVVATVVRLVVYGGAAGLFHLFLTNTKQTVFRKIQQRKFDLKIMRKEILWSASTIVIFSAFSPALFWAQERGYTRLYFQIEERGYVYFFGSILLLTLIHDLYFYLMHRALHIPTLYRRIHYIHHQARNPTVFSALSFHPIEAILEGAIVPLAILMIPLHPLALGLWFLWMLFTNIEGHCGYDFRSPQFLHGKLSGWLGGSHLHNDHHLNFVGNYGLYTCIWDKIFKTFKIPNALTRGKDSNQSKIPENGGNGRGQF